MKKAAINPTVSRLETPAIPLALSWLQDYNGEHGPAMDFSQAVPNFAPHPSLLTDLSDLSGSTKSCGYGEIQGEPVLREAYANYVSDFYQDQIEPENIHITSGCNQAFVATLIAVAAAGDSIVMTNPGYFNHEATAKMLGIRLRKVDCSAANGYIPDIEQLDSCIDESVRAVALVSPNNPCGTIYDTDSLLQIFQLCQKRGVWLILDETYRDFINVEHNTSGATACHTLFSLDNWYHNFIQLYSFSKSFCIPGHRLGAITAGTETIDAIARVMDNIQICPPRAAQLAVARQLPRLKPWIRANAADIAKRAQCFESMMQPLADWHTRSIGAYFAYVEHPFQNISSFEAARQLACEFGVLSLPGSFFGENQEHYLRIAFANAEEPVIRQLSQRLNSATEIMSASNSQTERTPA